MNRKLAHLNNPAVRRKAGKLHAMFCQGGAEIVVYLITVPVPLVNGFFPVKLIGFGGFVQNTGIGAKAQSPANIFHAVLVRHKGDNRMGGRGIKLNAVCVVKAGHVAGKLHDGKLHTQAKAQKRDIVGPCISDGTDFAVDSSGTEAAGNKDAVYVPEKSFCRFRGNIFRINPLDIDSNEIRNYPLVN